MADADTKKEQYSGTALFYLPNSTAPDFARQQGRDSGYLYPIKIKKRIKNIENFAELRNVCIFALPMV